MKYGRSLQELAIELDRQAKVKKDYVATAGAMPVSYTHLTLPTT